MADEGTRTDATLTEDLGPIRRASRIRTAALVFLGIGVAAGLLGVFDPRDDASSAAGGGFELEAEYPSSARAGIAAPLTITVSAPGGFEQEEVQVAVTRSWLELFESPDLQPETSAATADPDRVIWTFETPPGDELEISATLTLEPELTGGEDARISVVDEEGAELVGVDASTKVIP